MIEQCPSHSEINSQEAYEGTMRVRQYLETLQIIQRGVDTYFEIKTFEDGGKAGENTDERIRFVTALEDLHTSYNDSDKMVQFRKDWGEESDLLIQCYDRIQDSLKSLTRDLREQQYNPLQRIQIALQASHAIATTLTKEQRLRLFSLAGYSPDELTHIAKILGTSFTLAATSSAIAWTMAGSAAAYGGEHFHIADLPVNEKNVLIALSYGLHYISAGIKTVQNVRMLKRDDIGFSPDINATTMYLLLHKFFPKNKNMQTVGTWIAGMAPIIYSEIFSSLLILPNGQSMVVARNIAGTIFNSGMVAATETYIHFKNKMKSHIGDLTD